MNKRFYGVFLMSILLLGSFASFASATVNSWQASNPTLDSYYGGSIDDYWPILEAMEDDDCSATNTDFIVAIPPMGCSPSVVRSDLLAEQNVAVFCQLSAIKVNPLIDVSTIKSISFKGDYPEEVAGISFHPSRAAISSTTTLSGDPIEENIGYVVIVLKKQPDKGSLEEFVSGMLTATINYDADTIFGAGAGEYYIEPLMDYEWEKRASDFAFWGGKGYLRVKEIEENYAVVDIMSSKERVIDTVKIKEGDTSNPVYYPGQYCTASVELKLDKIDVSQDSAMLDIDGDRIWVRKGARLFNEKCVVSALTIEEDNSGVVRISCNGAEDFTLRLGILANDATETVEGEAVCGSDITKEQRTFEYGCAIDGRLSTCEYIAVNSTYLKSNKDDARSIGTWFYTKESDGEWHYNYKSPSPETEYVSGLVSIESETIDADGDGENNEAEAEQGQISYERFKDMADAVAQVASCYDNVLVGEPEVTDGKYSPSDNAVYYADLAEDVTRELVDTYPYESKETGEYWGEESLLEQIYLAGDLEDQKSQLELVDLFLETYPDSASFNYVRDLSVKLRSYDLSGSSRSLSVNGGYHTIRLDGLNQGGGDQDIVNVRLNGGSLIALKRDKVYDRNWEEIVDEDEAEIYPRMKVNSIGNSGARFTYYWKNSEEELKHETFSVSAGEYYTVGGLEVLVVDTQVREVAHISLIPTINNQKTEANFTFNIGVEKRVIELNPDKAEEKIKDLNDTINIWEDRLETLGDLISGMKTACFAVSGILALKSVTDGFDGSSVARSKVMDKFEEKCIAKGKTSNTQLAECYANYSDNIEEAVREYSAAITRVNERVGCANVDSVVDSGIFESRVVDSRGYVDELKKCAGIDDGWTVEVSEGSGNFVGKDQLTDARDYQAAILFIEACDNGGNPTVCEIAREEIDSALSDNVDRVTAEEAARDSLNRVGIRVPTAASSNTNAVLQEVVSAEGNKIDASEDNYLAQVFEPGTNDLYYVEINKDRRIVDVYDVDGKKLERNSREDYLRDYKCNEQLEECLDDRIADAYNFVLPQEGGSCTNRITDPFVRYYESGNIQGFVGVVPFDLNEGWYAYVGQEDYTESGEAKAFWICNVGGDSSMSDGPSGGDVCVRFSVNSGSNVIFTPCPGKSSSEVNSLYTKAQAAIREANVNGNGIDVDGRFVAKTSPVGTSTSGLECTDFMSVDDCNLMFNLCDPVVCPTSRCDLGGKYPVSDVISTGIIGSIALCLPNFGTPDEGGVLIPVCLSGIHAGLESYISLLESHKACLEENLDTGEYSGTCDEISAIYTCDFFWGQVSPLIDNFLPTLFTGGNEQMRGGAEYLTVQKSFDNLEKSVDFFTNSYAESTFDAFEVGGTEEIGTTFCNSFLGTSLPTSASLLEDLTSPTSPTQFYAQFSEDTFTDATVPSTSQYKVYYHIYAGEDRGVQYRVYLKDPPQSSYYANHQTVDVESGYITAGESADKSKDFTAPSGYKQLCVSLNGAEECGFKSVTSSFAVDYATQSYVNDQASMRGITSTEDCTSTSIGGFYPSSNLQDSVETSLGGDDIATTGVTRICATSNPASGVVAGNDVVCTSDSTCDEGYECIPLGETSGDYGVCENPKTKEKQISQGRWVDVGYCDDENIRCWLDSQSVSDAIGAYSALSGEDTTVDLVDYDIDEQYGMVENKLSFLKKQVNELEDKKDILLVGENGKSIEEIIEGLDVIIGVGDNPGEGFNIHKAQALNIKARLFRFISRAFMEEEPESEITGARYSNQEGQAQVAGEGSAATTENSGQDGESKEKELSLKDGVVYEDGESTEYRIERNDPKTKAGIYGPEGNLLDVLDYRNGGVFAFDEETRITYPNLEEYMDKLENNYEYDFNTDELKKKT